MATDRRRKTDQVVTPFTDPAFRRSSVYFDDIEYQRHFEQNLIRYNLLNGAQVDGKIENITNLINAPGGGGGGSVHVDCYWTKEGSDLLYEEGMVGVKCHPTLGDFEVRGNLVVEAKGDEDPYIDIVNWSDTEKDPMLRFAAGATIVRKFTMGMDDSDSDSWLLCSGDILTSTVTGEVVDLGKIYDGTMIVVDSGNARIKRHFTSNDMAYIAKIGSVGSGNDNFNGPRGVCSDGIYIYVCDCDNYRIVKRKVVDLSYVSQVGSFGTGNTQFKNPVGICTDGTHVYVADKINNRVTKLLCSDLSYSAKTAGTEGFNNPAAICTDGINLYIIQNPGETWRMIKLACSTLALLTRRLKDGYDNSITPQGIVYNLGYCYICQTNGSVLPVMKYRSSDLVYESEWGAWGTGDGQITAPYAIATNGSNIFVSDVGAGFANPQRIQKYTMAGVYVAKYGTYGSGDTNFYHVYGICMVGYISGTTTIPLRAPIIKASINGDWVDAYPVLRARDGIQLMEDGTVAATKYVQLLAPSAITASYDIILPAAVPTAQGHLSISTGGQISWGQDVRTTSSPTFVRIVSLSQATGTAPILVTSTTVCTNLNADLLDGNHASAFVALTAALGDTIYGNVTPAWAKLAGNITTTKKFLRQTGTGTISAAPAWDTIAVADLPAHNVLSATHGDAEVASCVRGDLITGQGASPTWKRLVKGTSGYFLKANADDAVWAVHGLIYSDVGAAAAVHYHDSDYISIIASPAANKFPYQTAGGELVDSTYDAASFATATHVHSGVYESVLGNPGADGYLLASTMAGVRSWISKNHDLLSSSHSDTSPDAVERGDILIGTDYPIPGWPFRKRIDLPVPTANLTDFPVEVPIVADADIGAACLASGYDIRFTAADGVTLLPYERESFAVVGGVATGIFWVKTNVATAGTSIYIYWGNPAATDVSTAVGTQWLVAGAEPPTIISKTEIQKVGGNPEWNSIGYSTEGYVSECAISLMAGQADKHCGMGFTDAPPSSPYSAEGIGYDWYFQPNGYCRVEVLGANVGTHGLYDTNTVFLITYDGSYIRFYKDGILKYEVARATGDALYADVAFYTPDGIVKNIVFGPSEAWAHYGHDNVVAADGGLTWGAVEGATKWTRLAKGTEGQVLTIVSGIPAWA